MDEEDKIIRDYLQKDKTISDNANKMFDYFIEEIKYSKKYTTKKGKMYYFKNIITIAACFIIIFIGSNNYATYLGYKNIFFMIKEKYEEKVIPKEEIFEDRDIIISYQSLYITKDIEMQINELQVKENKAQLFLFIQEHENNLTPFNFKVYDEENNLICTQSSSKKENCSQYTEILNLKNYNDEINKLNLEIYSKQNELLKTVVIDLKEKIIEAKSQVEEVEKISQIELNRFLSDETLKIYKDENIKQVLILKTVDITYSDSIYIVKYIYCTPTQADIENENVENLDLYIITAKFSVNKGKYNLLELDEPEMIN